MTVLNLGPIVSRIGRKTKPVISTYRADNQILMHKQETFIRN